MIKRRKNHSMAGFTLTEILIVMIILGLLAALVGPKLFQKVGSSKIKAAKTQIQLFGTALDAYRLDTGSYPDSSQGLNALRENPGVTSWDGPYLPKAVPSDPWGNPYQYRSPGDHGEYDLYSRGADGADGGEDDNADIVSWE